MTIRLLSWLLIIGQLSLMLYPRMTSVALNEESAVISVQSGLPLTSPAEEEETESHCIPFFQSEGRNPVIQTTVCSNDPIPEDERSNSSPFGAVPWLPPEAIV